jgi:hypothetical protein
MDKNLAIIEARRIIDNYILEGKKKRKTGNSQTVQVMKKGFRDAQLTGQIRGTQTQIEKGIKDTPRNQRRLRDRKDYQEDL